MALTRDFRETIQERAQREPAFRQALLKEGLQLINTGDFATGRAILRNYINASIACQERVQSAPARLGPWRSCMASRLPASRAFSQ
jgi:hypothetical protein